MSPFLPSAPHASRAPRPQPGAQQGWGMLTSGGRGGREATRGIRGLNQLSASPSEDLCTSRQQIVVISGGLTEMGGGDKEKGRKESSSPQKANTQVHAQKGLDIPSHSRYPCFMPDENTAMIPSQSPPPASQDKWLNLSRVSRSLINSWAACAGRASKRWAWQGLCRAAGMCSLLPMDVPGGISAVSKRKKELKTMATLLSSFPSIPGYNHIPRQYVDHYAMIQEPGENDPSKLLWGQSRECQEGPSGSFGSPLLHCSWRAAGLQGMASADANSSMLAPSLSSSSSSSPLRIAGPAAPLHVTAATAEVTLAGRRAAAPLSSGLAKN